MPDNPNAASGRIVRGDYYLALPRAPETWLVDHLLPVSGSMLLYGDPKVGKSYAALQLACCLTSGVEWLGFTVPTPTKVVYVQLDTPRSLWAERVAALAQEGYPVEQVYYADRETFGTFPFNILAPDHFRLLLESVAEVKPGVVIIDTLREAHAADENDSTEMQKTIAHLEAAVKPAALVLISHARKSNGEQGPSLMNDPRGSNYVVGRMDAICRFSKESFRVSSRTMEEHSTKLERLDDGTWRIAADDFTRSADRLLEQAKANPRSLREIARDLSSTTGKSESACRAYLRRRVGRAEARAGQAAQGVRLVKR